MNNFSDIKKRLSMSTTMPIGTDSGNSNKSWLMGSSTHNHKHDGSCCGHDHDHEDNCEEEDHTNPSGGCC